MLFLRHFQPKSWNWKYVIREVEIETSIWKKREVFKIEEAAFWVFLVLKTGLQAWGNNQRLTAPLNLFNVSESNTKEIVSHVSL